MDLLMWEKGPTYHQIICCAKLDKPLSVFSDDATSVPSHHPVTTWDIITYFGI